MSELEDLEKTLRQKEEAHPERRKQISWRRFRRGAFGDLEQEKAENLSSFWRTNEKTSYGSYQEEKRMRLGSLFFWTLAVSLIILAAVGGLIFFFAGGGVIGGRAVTLAVNGPPEAASGSEVVWTVLIKNDNDKAIEGINVAIVYPDGHRDRQAIGRIPRNTA